jgi:hypothetical protein
MEAAMSTSLLIKAIQSLELTKYEPPKDPEDLKKTHVAFTGSPRKHPYDALKIILVSDPYSYNNHYYEFRTDDISYVEELTSIVNMDEEVIPMVRIWVRKRSIGVRCTPFWVEDLR